jgi:hypothetical protein
MAKYVYVVMTNPVEGREDEFNDWYTNGHLADILRLGFQSAQRFQLASMRSPQVCGQKYLAIYEVETDDIDAVNEAMIKAAGTPALQLSTAMDFASIQTWFFEAITDKMSA